MLGLFLVELRELGAQAAGQSCLWLHGLELAGFRSWGIYE
jgi:hypothetical protein